MGNLGRAGYGATTDGMWPYSYDSCDVGTMPNQTYLASQGGGPVAAETTGVFVDQYGPGLSYLPGQRLSRCTCRDSTEHPGPRHSDGSFVGRSAPEIDIIEAQAANRRGARGHVSMSLQLAPFDTGYNLTTEPGAYEFFDTNNAELNSYTGSVYQQAASGLVYTKNSNYMETSAEFDTYGFEYKVGKEPDSHITWTVGGEPQWRMNAKALFTCWQKLTNPLMQQRRIHSVSGCLMLSSQSEESGSWQLAEKSPMSQMASLQALMHP